MRSRDTTFALILATLGNAAYGQSGYPPPPSVPTSRNECRDYLAQIERLHDTYYQQWFSCWENSQDASRCRQLYELVDIDKGPYKNAHQGYEQCRQVASERDQRLQMQIDALNEETQWTTTETQQINQSTSAQDALASQYQQQAEDLKRQGFQVNESQLNALAAGLLNLQPPTPQSASAALPSAADPGLSDYLATIKDKTIAMIEDKAINTFKKGLPEWTDTYYGENAADAVRAAEWSYDVFGEMNKAKEIWDRIDGADNADGARAAGEGGALAAKYLFQNAFENALVARESVQIGQFYGNGLETLGAGWNSALYGVQMSQRDQEMFNEPWLWLPIIKDFRDFNIRLTNSYARVCNVLGPGNCSATSSP